MIFLPPTAGNRLAWDRYTHIKKRTAEAKSEYCEMPPCLEVRKCAMLEKSHRMYKHAVGVYLVPVGLLMPSFGVAIATDESKAALPHDFQSFPSPCKLSGGLIIFWTDFGRPEKNHTPEKAMRRTYKLTTPLHGRYLRNTLFQCHPQKSWYFGL
jgi:hypothetical protein